MSGQPYKNQLDILKVREAYLANLKLRAELDDKNLQANRQSAIILLLQRQVEE